MTEQQIRIELAQADGWTITEHNIKSLPELSLDWIHEIITNRLTEAQRKALRFHFYGICGQMFAHCADKMQMAEAVLTVLGKWK